MTDVLICGAGPIGLTLSIELARRGVDVKVVERAIAMPSDPRALIVKPSTLYACEHLGVLDELMATGIPTEVVEYAYEGRTVVVARSPEERWPWNVNMGEDRLVPVLTARLESLGVAVERGIEMVDVDETDDAVRVRLRDRGGHERHEEAAWMVGCDGVHSTTRDRIGVTFDGRDSAVHWHVLDAQIDGWPYKDSHGLFFMDAVMMAVYRTRSAFRIYMISNEDTAEAWAAARAYLRDRVPTAELGPAIADNAFRCSARIASTYRKGRVLLAGDATHSMSPGSAAGLNTGIQDALNLGWKLADVVAGHAEPTLLDTFEDERRKVAMTMTEVGQQNDDMLTLADPAERSRAIRHFAVTMSDYLRRGGNGYQAIMGAYDQSAIVCGERPSVGPGPGDYVNADMHMRRVDGDLLYLTTALASPGHSLLLLLGNGGPNADRILRSAIELRDRSGGVVKLVAVGRDTESTAGQLALASGEESFYLDPELDLHNRLGVAERAIMWIRPDGRIASRDDDAETVDTVAAHLAAALPGISL